VPLKVVHYKQQKFNISYEIQNPKAKRDFILLHGWGSNKELMRGSFATCLGEFRHIYIDLPGFGNSSNEIFLHVRDYADIIELFLQQIGAEKEVVLGHSFGGKIATLLAPKYLVLVASAGILTPKPLHVRLKIALNGVLKPLKLKFLRDIFVSDDGKNLSENMYEIFKYTVNEDFSENFLTCKSKTLLLWGKKDTATPIESAHKINELIKQSRLIEFEGDHYFFMSEKELTCKALENFTKELLD
jgi:pimeloyl-ACP methyl ester carboxylesterase